MQMVKAWDEYKLAEPCLVNGGKIKGSQERITAHNIVKVPWIRYIDEC